ncbi:MAG: hypothetical protein CM1200mP29_15150 [Verrucomicrobiota bacterium]|nr:MAG: hypothetical protein CM1200mP29_15150 [Verrucomicrobiota bacterium]
MCRLRREATCRFSAARFPRTGGASTINRYTNYAFDKLKEGMPYTDTMKKLASGVFVFAVVSLSLPDKRTGKRPLLLPPTSRFFFGPETPGRGVLISQRMVIWAQTQKCWRKPSAACCRPKVERFLDSFPSQWMQLENILPATPDPKLHRYFSLDKQHPASLQMLFEPLLLFDAVFVDNRPIPSWSCRPSVIVVTSSTTGTPVT